MSIARIVIIDTSSTPSPKKIVDLSSVDYLTRCIITFEIEFER